MKPTVIKILNRHNFNIQDRGDMGTIDLLNVLKTVLYGIREDRHKIERLKRTSNVCLLTLYPFGNEGSEITSGTLKIDDILFCIENIQRKFAKEILGEVEELQGVLKGKDLQRYLDQMIQQNNSKGNTNN